MELTETQRFLIGLALFAITVAFVLYIRHKHRDPKVKNRQEATQLAMQYLTDNSITSYTDYGIEKVTDTEYVFGLILPTEEEPLTIRVNKWTAKVRLHRRGEPL